MTPFSNSFFFRIFALCESSSFDAVGQRMEIDSSRVMINIERFGNTTAATIPLLLWEAESKLKKGDDIILAAFGAGFTWGAMWLKWAY